MPGAPRGRALAAMSTRFGYPADEALTRARVLYYMQIGHNDAELHEPMAERLHLIPHYLLIFTGQTATTTEVVAFTRAIQALISGNDT